MRAFRRTLTLACILAVLAGTTACREGEAPRTPPRPTSPTLVIGADALEWDVVLPMVRRGDLPAIERLMERGVYGDLATDRPTLSPILWTSMATGKGPGKHGVRGFTTPIPGTGKARLTNSLDRRTKAVWNILSDYDRHVAVIGWYVTHPAEALNGVMVSQTQTSDQMDRSQGRAIMMGRLVEGVRGQVYPPGRSAELMAVRARAVERFPEFLRATFGSFSHDMHLLSRTHWENSRWALEADLTFLSIAEHLLADHEPYDLMMVYANGADVLGHRFWRHYEPDSFAKPPPVREREDFGELITVYYRFLDARLARLSELAHGDVNIVLVSDHGMHATNRESDFDVDSLPDDMSLVTSGHHRDAPPGVFLAAGPDVRRKGARPVRELQRGHLGRVGSIYDLAPTLLALAGVPAGRDMRGRVLEHVLARSLAVPPAVASHDDPAWLAARSELSPNDVENPSEAIRIRQLQALGYIE